MMYLLWIYLFSMCFTMVVMLLNIKTAGYIYANDLIALFV